MCKPLRHAATIAPCRHPPPGFPCASVPAITPPANRSTSSPAPAASLAVEPPPAPSRRPRGRLGRPGPVRPANQRLRRPQLQLRAPDHRQRPSRRRRLPPPRHRRPLSRRWSPTPSRRWRTAWPPCAGPASRDADVGPLPCRRFTWKGRTSPPEDGPRGAHPQRHVRPPDWDEFRRLQDAAGGRIRLVTLAPEHDGALPFIERLTAAGVVVALGHTAASGERIRDAVRAGARLSTHLGNGSHAVLPRHDNYIWEQLADDGLWASLICDGHHLPPSVVRCIVRVKTPARTILTCDASSLAGLPPGRYREWDQDFEVLPAGKVVVPGTSYLAGSWAFTDLCVGNVIRFAGVEPGRRRGHGRRPAARAARPAAAPPGGGPAGRTGPVRLARRRRFPAARHHPGRRHFHRPDLDARFTRLPPVQRSRLRQKAGPVTRLLAKAATKPVAANLRNGHLAACGFAGVSPPRFCPLSLLPFLACLFRLFIVDLT